MNDSDNKTLYSHVYIFSAETKFYRLNVLKGMGSSYISI